MFKGSCLYLKGGWWITDIPTEEGDLRAREVFKLRIKYVLKFFKGFFVLIVGYNW